MFKVINKTFEKFGFAPLETPSFESWELLGAKGGGGEAIKDEIYYFKDKGGRGMGLRFDFTASLARVVASNPQLAKPFKRYQIGPVWRYDNPQAGRFREFWQADIDIAGSRSMAADAECIAALASCLKDLGFKDFVIRLNSRKLLNGLVEAAGINDKKAPSVFRSLDKLEKQGQHAVEKELKKSGATAKQIEKIMGMISISGQPKEAMPKARQATEGFMDAKQGLDDLEEIVELSKAYGTAGMITIDLSLVRGLDYYTGPIFEIKSISKKGSSVGNIAGGGRYDNLIELYGGQPTPATGGSLGVERIFEIMLEEGMFAGIPKEKTLVFVAAAMNTPAMKKFAIQTSQKLRQQGIATETDVMGRKLKKGLEYADSKGIPYMIIIGEKEIKSGKMTLKDLRSGEQRLRTLKSIVVAVRKYQKQ